MGQYHLVANLTKREYLHPHHLGDGFKLLEWGCSGDSTSLALSLLLTGPSDHPVIGRWAGDAIVVLGDYYEATDIPGRILPDGLWEAMTNELGGWHNLSGHVLPVFAALGVDEPTLWFPLDPPTTKVLFDGSCVPLADEGEPFDVGWGVRISDAPLYVCNLDKKQYLRPATFGQQAHLLGFGREGVGTTTALACLLAVSNNRGGGDLYVNGEPGAGLVGMWGGDHIVITYALPMDDFSDISRRALQMICLDAYVAEEMKAATS